MIFWIFNCVAVLALCILFAGIIIPQILLISFRRKLFDEPDGRKIHHGAVPRLGGIAFKPVIFFSIALLIGVEWALGQPDILDQIGGPNAGAMAFGYCTIMILYLVGMADDLIGIRYSAKFIFQIICGIMLIAGGVWVNDLHGILGLHALPKWFGYPLTVFIVVFIINSVNLIDGIDGLASGLCSVALLFYGVSFFLLEQYIYAMLSFGTLGVLIPFFYYNVFGNSDRNKKIFMGDTGSLTVGMMISFLSIKLLLCDTDGAVFTPNPFVLAFAPLIIPCFDVVRVYIHRVRNRKNPFKPDMNHIHHKLLALGMNQHAAMITILTVSVIITLCNLVASRHVNVNILLAADVIVYTVSNILLTRAISRRHNPAAVRPKRIKNISI